MSNMRDQKYQTEIVVFKCGTAMATPGWNVSFTHVVVLRVFEVVQLMVNTMNPHVFRILKFSKHVSRTDSYLCLQMPDYDV